MSTSRLEGVIFLEEFPYLITNVYYYLSMPWEPREQRHNVCSDFLYHYVFINSSLSVHRVIEGLTEKLEYIREHMEDGLFRLFSLGDTQNIHEISVWG